MSTKKSTAIILIYVATLLILLFLPFTAPFIHMPAAHAFSYDVYAPVYKSLQELRTPVSSGDAQPLEEIGKIYVYKDYIFVNELYKGVHVIDNRDPSNPKAIAFIDIPGNVDIAVRNNFLYADSWIDLVVVDISNPTDVTEIKRVEDVFPNTGPTFLVMDELETASHFEEVDSRQGIVIGWEYAHTEFFYCFPSGTEVLTAHGPSAIETVKKGTEVYAYDPSSGEWTLTKVDTHQAYQYEGDVITIQMNSIEIQTTGHHPFYVMNGNRLESRPLPLVIPEDEQGMFGSGRWVEARHLQVGDTLRRMNGDGLSITGLSSRYEKTTVYHLEVEGRHTFGVHEAGILVHNKSAGPSSSTGKGGSLARFAIVDDYLYTLSGSDMQLYDISNPAEPIVWKMIKIGWDIETIFPYEDKLFIGGQRGMYIYDNNDPAHPIQISRFAHVTSCDPVVVEDDTAYVTLRGGTRCGGQNNRLEIIDISNYSKPHLIADYPMDGPYGLGIDRGLLFICDGNAGLKLFDASDPKDLKLVRRFRGLKTLDVILHRDIAIVVGETGLHQYNYRALEKMTLISVISTRDDGYSALMKAVRHGRKNIVRSLLQSGADVNASSMYGRTALIEAVIHGHTEIVGLLLQAGADVNARHGVGGWTALVKAVHHDNLAIMELLIQAGADVNARYAVSGWTALMWASSKGNTEMVELLLQAEADVNGMNDEGDTALMWTAYRGNMEIVELLIQAKADVNVIDENGETALEIAARYGYDEVVQILLDTGAEVNAGSSYGRTALMSAALSGHTYTVTMLLTAGADVNVLNKDGKSALMLAQEKGHTAIVDMLIEAGEEE